MRVYSIKPYSISFPVLSCWFDISDDADCFLTHFWVSQHSFLIMMVQHQVQQKVACPVSTLQIQLHVSLLVCVLPQADLKVFALELVSGPCLKSLEVSFGEHALVGAIT